MGFSGALYPLERGWEEYAPRSLEWATFGASNMDSTRLAYCASALTFRALENWITSVSVRTRR